MAKKLAFERYHWFHGQIKAGRYPNARKLAEEFEISQKQAQRDIEFIRDRLNAPLIYNPVKKGYEYEDSGYELPPIWFKEDEILALCLALRLSTTLPDRNLKKSLCHILEKFLTFRYLDSTFNLADIQARVSVKNIQYYKVAETIFHKVVDALFRNQSVKISYYTPHKDETTERVVLPLHLLCYMGSWHLIAYCSLRDELRDFALSRIKTIGLSTQRINMPNPLPSIKDYMRRNFGLMSGGKSVEVCLRFSPETSNWVSEQIWHPSQEVSWGKDGGLCLKFPVADIREVRREILKYGAGVEVISPDALREEIKNEIKKMKNLYR